MIYVQFVVIRVFCQGNDKIVFQTATEKCIINTKTPTKKCIGDTKTATKKCKAICKHAILSSERIEGWHVMSMWVKECLRSGKYSYPFICIVGANPQI